jgi:holin-like protein
MKYIKQFLVILALCWAGELLHAVLPLPVPASIYGLVLLFGCLMGGVIRVEQVRETGRFLIEIMPLLFIPASVGLIDSWGVLRGMLLPVATITVVSTVVVMAVTGRFTQWIIRRDCADREEKSHA